MKTAEIQPYRDWDEVDAALAEMGKLESQLNAIQAKLDENITQAKMQAQRAAAGLIHRQQALEAAIEKFLKGHRKEFNGTRSRQLPFGSVGFRLRRWVVVRQAERAFEWFEQRFAGDFIRRRVEIDKEALRSFLILQADSGESLEEFEKHGIRLRVADEPFIEINHSRGFLSSE